MPPHGHHALWSRLIVDPRGGHTQRRGQLPPAAASRIRGGGTPTEKARALAHSHSAPRPRIPSPTTAGLHRGGTPGRFTHEASVGLAGPHRCVVPPASAAPHQPLPSLPHPSTTDSHKHTQSTHQSPQLPPSARPPEGAVATRRRGTRASATGVVRYGPRDHREQAGARRAAVGYSTRRGGGAAESGAGEAGGEGGGGGTWGWQPAVPRAVTSASHHAPAVRRATLTRRRRRRRHLRPWTAATQGRRGSPLSGRAPVPAAARALVPPPGRGGGCQRHHCTRRRGRRHGGRRARAAGGAGTPPVDAWRRVWEGRRGVKKNNGATW